jgi:hypothetical protein
VVHAARASRGGQRPIAIPAPLLVRHVARPRSDRRRRQSPAVGDEITVTVNYHDATNLPLGRAVSDPDLHAPATTGRAVTEQRRRTERGA